MSELTGAQEAPILGAIDVLMERLEREHAQLTDLRARADAAEQNCSQLQASIGSAAELLPRADRQRYRLRVAKLAVGQVGHGRPPKDKRQAAILEYLALRVDETITNAEIRNHLNRLGIANSSRYLSNRLASWASEGMLTRLAHGLYRVNAGDARLLAMLERNVPPEPLESDPPEPKVTPDSSTADRFEEGAKLDAEIEECRALARKLEAMPEATLGTDRYQPSDEGLTAEDLTEEERQSIRDAFAASEEAKKPKHYRDLFPNAPPLLGDDSYWDDD